MSPRLLVLYGSQTGTAQDVAEQLWRESKRYGFSGPVLPMDECPLERLVAGEESLVAFVVATTGEGDEPDNMTRTWKFLLRRNLPSDLLQHLQFFCLGLGDSGYAKFNYAAKKLHKRLQQLGAHALLPLALGDDQHDRGWAAEALPWMAQVWQVLSAQMGLSAGGTEEQAVAQSAAVFKWTVEVATDESTKNEETIKDAEVMRAQWLPAAKANSSVQAVPPIELTLQHNERTTAAEHFQDVRLLRFQYPPSVVWQPGDVLQLRPHNSSVAVDRFWALAAEYAWSFKANTKVRICSAFADMPLPAMYAGGPLTVQQLVTYVWDLTGAPRRRLFELLALHCRDELEHEKLLEFCSGDGVDDLIAYAHRPRRTVLEVLTDFPQAAAKLTLSTLVELFAPIQPRSYSIASAAALASSERRSLDLLVAVVEYRTIMSTPRLGLCSNWLRGLLPGTTVCANIKKGTMRLPADPRTPLIMIGPGTGIAPFRSVVQSRLAQQQGIAEVAGGQLFVFFGCRNRDKDCHFAGDYARWQDRQHEKSQLPAIQVFIAYSRDQPEKVYVQHLIRQHAALLRPLICAENASVFVAGAANAMPKAVREAFVEVIDKDLAAGQAYIEEMLKTKRYQEETWS